MRAYSKTEDFKQLNVGFVLDEGVASADDVYNVYYAERCPWCRLNFQMGKCF